MKFKFVDNVALSSEDRLLFDEYVLPFESSSLHLTSMWDESVEAYKKGNEVVIEFIDDIPSEFVDNQILLKLSDKHDKKSKSFCFFRHIRNAYAHNRVWRINSSNVIQARDVNPNNGETTMVLQCSIDFLKGLIFKILDTSPFQTMDDISDYYEKSKNKSIKSKKKKETEVLVYHYTEFDSLTKMLNCPIEQSENDANKMIPSKLSVRLTAINNFIEGNRDDESVFELLNNECEKVSSDNGHKWHISKEIGNPYIFCFSDYDNNRRLWDVYSAKETGIVIGFAYRDLLKHFVEDRDDNNFYFAQCHYITENQVKQRVLQFGAELKRQSKIKEEKIIAYSMRDILRCKALKYEVERETRMIYFSPSKTKKYEYIEMPISLVKRIIIGKYVSSEKESKIRQLVNNIKRALNVEIVISNYKLFND